MTDASHGLAPTPEISAADQKGAFAPAASPAAALPTTDPTQAGRTLPIGGADGGQANVYKPTGLPEHLIGQDDKQTIDRLASAYKGARDEIAKARPPAAKPEDYKWSWSDKVAIGKDDPAIKEFAAIAAEHGFTQQQIDAIPKFFDRMADKGVIEKPFDAAALLTELAPADFRGSTEERQAKGGERLAQAETWIRQLAPAHGFDEAMKNELRLLTTSVAGVKTVEMLMRSGMNPSVSAGGGLPGAVSKADLDARVADPRNSAYSPKFDPAYAEETRRLFKAMYPG